MALEDLDYWVKKLRLARRLVRRTLAGMDIEFRRLLWVRDHLPAGTQSTELGEVIAALALYIQNLREVVEKDEGGG